MVEAFEDLAEGALSDSFLYFEPVGDVVVGVADILTLVVVEAVVLGSVWSREGLLVPLEEVDEPDLVVLEDFGLFVVEQEFAEVEDDVSWLHWELDLELSFLLCVESCATSDR